jgi:hypothetical protein
MRRLLACLALSLIPIASSQAQVKLMIKNLSGQPDANIWIQWTNQAGNGGADSLTGTSNGISIAPSTYVNNTAGYRLSAFASPSAHTYEIDKFTMNGGRMNFTFGASGFTIPSDGYTPPPNNFNDPNFTRRTDKVEASIIGGVDDNIDMTAVDAFSIPFKIEGYNSTAPTETLQTLESANGDAIVAALGTVAANPSAAAPKPPPGGTVPHIADNSPYLIINSESVGLNSPPPYTYSPVGSKGTFVRVIGNDQLMANAFYNQSPNCDPVALANGNPPNSPASAAIPANYLYKPFNNYLAYLDGTGTPHYAGTTSIAGSFAGVGDGQPGHDETYAQTYTLTPRFNPTGTMMFNDGNGNKTYTGFLSMTGTTKITKGPDMNVSKNITLRIPYTLMLGPRGIVGANAGYEITYGGTGPTDVGTPQNDVWTWIEGDFFAGMNIGAVGSDTLFTGTVNGHTYKDAKVGQMPSQDWFYIGAFLAKPDQKVWQYYFDYLQHNSDYYNTYGAVLYPLTDAYNFSYSDRVQGGQVAISWNAQGPDPIVTIEITILPDAGTEQ